MSCGWIWHGVHTWDCMENEIGARFLLYSLPNSSKKADNFFEFKYDFGGIICFDMISFNALK